MDPMQGSVLRDVILNTRKPLVLKDFNTGWKCVDCPIEDWCERFDVGCEGKVVELEEMPMRFGDCPQWERYRTKIKSSLKEFLESHTKSSEKWTAFNYKRSEDIPIECRFDIDFSCFGFPDAATDASFWISSKGANTPCHYDTYGCNIVVQVYGRKHWLLFPPDAQLTPTRVPYEESSVYCSENFFSPKSLESLSAVRSNGYECVLEESDALIVPRNWWHYVESLETSLSINAWIPLEVDLEAQIKECIVKFIVEKSITGEPEEIKQYILNPNQLDLTTSNGELLEIFRILLDSSALSGKVKSNKFPYEYLSESKVCALLEKLRHNINVLELVPSKEIDQLLNERSRRYTDATQPDKSKMDPIYEALLNAICHPVIVKSIRDRFLTALSSKS